MLWLLAEPAPDAIRIGLAGLLAVLLTVGVGVVFALHAQNSLQASRQARCVCHMPGCRPACSACASSRHWSCLPPALPLLGTALPTLFVSGLRRAAAAGAGLVRRRRGRGLTWRRGLTALAAGATLGVAIAVALEGLIAAVALALVAGLADAALPGVDLLLDAVAGKEIAWALADSSLVFVFIELALIAPLVEEAVKPLVVLPLLAG